jgi:periplasmic protein TonB
MRTKLKPKKPELWQHYGLAGGVAFVFLAAAYGVYAMVNSDAVPRKRVMETIALKLVPPPPPPPPPPEAPPPPPKMLEQKIEQPVDKPDDAPKPETPSQAADLGASQGPCTSSCVATSGRDPTYRPETIGGNGPGRVNYGHYAALMQDQIGRRIRQDEKLEAAKFRATIRIWLDNVGGVQRVELARTTGDNDLDTRIRKMIGTMPALPEAPPKDMPQPVIVRLGATPGFG